MESCRGYKELYELERAMREEVGRAKVKFWRALFSFDTLKNVGFTCLITSLLALTCFSLIHFQWTTFVPQWLALAMVVLALIVVAVRSSKDKDTGYELLASLGYVVGVCVLTNTPWLPAVVLIPFSVGLFAHLVVDGHNQFNRHHERLIWNAGEMSRSDRWKCLAEVVEKDMDKLLRDPIEKLDRVIVSGERDPYFQKEKDDLSAIVFCLEQVPVFFRSCAEQMSSHVSAGTTVSSHAYMLGVYMESSYRGLFDVLDALSKDLGYRPNHQRLMEMAKKIVPAETKPLEAMPKNPA
ncbi:MAG: hypothetical protein Q7S19_00690 [bacterium]|nr:hypothetical protein [bacterium]